MEGKAAGEAIHFSGNVVVNEGFSVTGSAGIRSTGVQGNTTANSPNVYIDTTVGAVFRRATSAKKYKRDIESVELSYAENFLNNCQPIWFRSKGEGDNPNHSFYGYTADDVAKTEPRLVQYDDKGNPDGFNYDRVAALLHPIVKDNRERIERLEKLLERAG